MIKIGVIVPVYNSGAKLFTTINSILVQTGDYELQVLIIDDFSSDDTTKVTLRELGKHPLIKVIHNDRNIGICESRNKGLTLLSASTDYIMFVDHDDIINPFAIDNFLKSFTQQSNAIAVMGVAYKFGPLVTIEENEQFIKSQLKRRNISFCNGKFDVTYNNVSQLTFPIILSSYTFHPPAKAMIRTKALINSGITFEKRFELVEDWIFWIKLLKHGDILAIDKVTAGYLWHQSNNSQRKDQVFRLKYAWWYLFWYSLQSRNYLISYLTTTGRNRIDACDSYMNLSKKSLLTTLKYVHKSCITLFIEFILFLLLRSKTINQQ